MLDKRINARMELGKQRVGVNKTVDGDIEMGGEGGGALTLVREEWNRTNEGMYVQK